MHERLLDGDETVAADQHAPLFSEVERDDRNVFQVDVVPHVEFGPVGERKDADALTWIYACVIEVPQFGPLVFWIPLSGAVAKGEDTLLGAGFFFVSAGSSESGVKTVGTQAIEQRGGLEQSTAAAGSQGDGVGSASDGGFIAPYQQLHAELAGIVIAKGDHLAEFVTGVDM